MLTSTLWITRFFLLIYVLISVSTANASFWCQESGSPSHLESNPVGECWALSALEKDELLCCEKITQPGVFLSVPGEYCFDYPAYSSVLTSSNRISPLIKIATTDIALITLSFSPSKESGVARFANLTLASQLPHPQALTALRTVILLH